MALQMYKAAEAATAMKTSRARIDAACSTGALVAVDERPESTKRAWRISEAALLDWHDRGRPWV